MTMSTIRKLVEVTYLNNCRCCGIHRTLEWEDSEIGLICESCAEELLKVDTAINYDIPWGVRRPEEGDENK